MNPHYSKRKMRKAVNAIIKDLEESGGLPFAALLLANVNDAFRALAKDTGTFEVRSCQMKVNDYFEFNLMNTQTAEE